MTRILADLPDEDIKWLDEAAIALRRSRSSLICEAVKFFRGNPDSGKNRDWLEVGFGLWKGRTDIAARSNGKGANVHRGRVRGMMIMKRRR